MLAQSSGIRWLHSIHYQFAACTNAIRSGEVQGAGLVVAYVNRGNRYDGKTPDQAYFTPLPLRLAA